MLRICCLLPLWGLIWCGLAATAWAETPGPRDWPWWRGPYFNGQAGEGEQPPLTWSATEHVLWKTPVPGRGHASPTVVGDRIFLATADEQAQTQSVLCFRRSDGQPQWSRTVSQGGFPRIHPKNTHASGTVACDGERVYATFHHHAHLFLYALTVEGELLWEQDVGPYDPKLYEYGYAGSPLLYRDLVIVAADVETGGRLAAFDRRTGTPHWKTDRPHKYSFSSPIVAPVAGRELLLLSGCDAVMAYDPASGRLLWSTPGTTYATCGTMVWDGDRVFASGGYPKAETLAIRADGAPEVLWRNDVKCYEQSLLAYHGHVYAVSDQGIAYCWRATDGQERWKSRLGGLFSASPILAGNRIYASNEAGTTFVFRADPEQFELLATNQLGTEAFATPAVCGNRIYLRVASGEGASRQEQLYCLGD